MAEKPMIRNDSFWADEKDAAILKLNNNNYLQKHEEALIKQTSHWLSLAGVESPKTPIPLVHVENPHRLVIADTERTFMGTKNREMHVKLVAHMDHTFKEYAQAMCLVSGFLRLTLPQSDVIALLTKLHHDEKYIPGYWQAESVPTDTDAYVMQELSFKHVPEVAAHLQKHSVDPTLYCKKSYLAVGVPNFPFEHLFTYFEEFLKGGHKFLIQFTLSLLTQLRETLLANKQTHQLAGILQLDPNYFPHNAKFDEVIKNAFAHVKDFNLDDVNFKEMREQAFNKHLKARMEAAKAAALAREDEDDDIEDCQICKDDFPEVHCKECNLKICENCHNKPPAGSTHLRAHKVKQLEEDEGSDDSDKSDNDDDDEEKDAVVDKAAASLEKLKV